MKYKKSNNKRIIILSIAVVALFVFLGSYTIIPTGHTGVKVTFGQVSSEPLRTGFNWKIPFIQSIKKVNNKQQDIEFKKNQIWSETSERTALYFENITVTYQISAEKSTWIYANVSDFNNLVSEPLVTSAIKSSAKKLDPISVTNRAIIEPLVRESLQSALDEKYGVETVSINRVVINNIDFEDSYNQAIAEKQNAQLAYERQQIENKKSVEAAEAAALVRAAEAKARADALLIEAKAEAEANTLRNNSITEMILKDKLYSAWDGKLPMIVGSEGNIIDIGSLIK